MRRCMVCGWRLVEYQCRRCGREICRNCYSTHGLCIKCYYELVRVGKNAL